MVHHSGQNGFTLIELSIVLVIIGLIVGGVLVGQDLIHAAEVRATLSQIEKYNTAANTFLQKYGGLPGDIPAAQTVQFGFTVPPSRAGTDARGDGNGLIEAWSYSNSTIWEAWPESSESLWFWEDLTANSGLIEGNYNTAVDSGPTIWVPGGCSSPDLWIPPAKISNDSIYVYSYNAVNYFALSGISTSTVANSGNCFIDSNGHIYTTPGLTVAQAYAIDKKSDDGLPTEGNIQAMYPGAGGASLIAAAANASSPSSATCYDTTSNTYSLSQNDGAGPNCGLSFRMQAGN